jgi:hypothetical protein
MLLEVKKDIRNKKSNGDLHGYQEWFDTCTGVVWFRCEMKNDLGIGYSEMFFIEETRFYI